jgi:hypothetical protein
MVCPFHITFCLILKKKDITRLNSGKSFLSSRVRSTEELMSSPVRRRRRCRRRRRRPMLLFAFRSNVDKLLGPG